MALSIVSQPNNFFEYIADHTYLNEIPSIVTNNITAFKDLNGTSLPLVIGASGNLELETIQDVNMYMGNSNAYRLFKSSFDSNTSIRTDVEILKVDSSFQTSTTTLSASSNFSILSSNPLSTYSIGSMTIKQVAGEQLIGTSLSNLIFTNNVVAQGDLTVGANIFTSGNIFGGNVNIWTDKPDSLTYNRVGYGLRVNSNDQLEMIKYARFADKTVTKRVAVFGHANFTSNDVSDSGSSSYLAFNSLGSISVVGSNGSLSPIVGGGSATSGSNMTLSGVTSLAGNIVPTITSTTLGSVSSFINTVFSSNLQANNFKLQDGSSLLLNSFTSTSTSNAPTAAALASVFNNTLPLSGGIITGNLTVSGNMIVSGTTTTVDTQTLLIKDNVITLNTSLSNAAPPNNLISGIEVNRGSQPNYLFVFDEASQFFKIGLSNQLQTVCTRDSMISGYAYFDSSTQKLINRPISYSDVASSPWQYVSYSNNNSNIVFSTTSNSPNVGIGTSNPDYKLTVNGQIYASDDITAFSDRTMKDNLVKIPNALNKVLSVNGYTFTRKDMDNQKTYAGVIAQEMKEVLPEVIYQNSQGLLSVAYGNITALLIEAVKELNAKVEDLMVRN